MKAQKLVREVPLEQQVEDLNRLLVERDDKIKQLNATIEHYKSNSRAQCLRLDQLGQKLGVLTARCTARGVPVEDEYNDFDRYVIKRCQELGVRYEDVVGICRPPSIVAARCIIIKELYEDCALGFKPRIVDVAVAIRRNSAAKFPPHATALTMIKRYRQNPEILNFFSKPA